MRSTGEPHAHRRSVSPSPHRPAFQRGLAAPRRRTRSCPANQRRDRRHSAGTARRCAVETEYAGNGLTGKTIVAAICKPAVVEQHYAIGPQPAPTAMTARMCGEGQSGVGHAAGRRAEGRTARGQQRLPPREPVVAGRSRRRRGRRRRQQDRRRRDLRRDHRRPQGRPSFNAWFDAKAASAVARRSKTRAA